MNFGSVSVLPCAICASALSCRIMFMRARPAVVASFSWPYSVSLLRASSATFNNSEAEPHVGSYTVVALLVFASRTPSTCAMIRLTSAGV